jgi:D-glycero-alpha-D-manno-heptose-7-phosphate kinase
VFIWGIRVKSKLALEQGELIEFGRLMDVHWQHKKKRSSIMSNGDIDRYYEIGMANGAVGGGFLMFYAADKARLRHAMREAGLREVRFRFDFEGTKILVSE